MNVLNVYFKLTIIFIGGPILMANVFHTPITSVKRPKMLFYLTQPATQVSFFVNRNIALYKS